jgi:hypothetical protein
MANLRMTKFILTTAIAAAIGVPSIAIAQTVPTSGSIVCRPANAGETANATVQNIPLVCHPQSDDSVRNATGAAPPNRSPDQKANRPAARGVVPGNPFLPYPGFDGNPND